LIIFLIIAFLAASWKECQGPLKGAASSLEVFGLLDRKFAGKNVDNHNLCYEAREVYFATPCSSHETNNISMTFKFRYI